MEMWKTKPVSHISTPPTATTDKGQKRRYTNIPLGTKDRSGHALLSDARRKKFSAVMVTAFDRIARSTRNFLQIIDELDSLGIEFISRREGVATGDAMGRLFVTIISAIAELERSLVVERVKSGMRRAKLEGKVIGRARLDVDREQVVFDRRSMSLTEVARKHSISRASVCRITKQESAALPPASLPCGEQLLVAAE
ncbi:MAG TPA: recombinase family protein [Terriglobales bacterium]